MSGTIVWATHTSKILKGNPLKDPHTRRFPIILPPAYGGPRKRRHPVVFLLTGHFGSGAGMPNWNAFQPGFAERISSDAIIVMPDCFTALGGGQYINSTACGRYEDYLVREIVPWVDVNFATIHNAAHRAVIGKSSGAYGSLMLAMRHPDVFGLCGWRSGDAYFDFCYRKDIVTTLVALEKFGGSIKKFLADWRRKKYPLNNGYADVINILAMAACYAPNPRSPHGFDLPVNLRTGEWNEKVWRRWLAHDPLNCVSKYKSALKKLKWVYLECGRSDEYGLLYGTRQLSAKLRQLGIRHHYEEFNGGHRNTNYRYDYLIQLITKRMS
jgi:enterochelin esterase family protein